MNREIEEEEEPEEVEDNYGEKINSQMHLINKNNSNLVDNVDIDDLLNL